MLETIKELCALPGVSGCENTVRDYIERRVRPYADEMMTDAMGNLIVFKRGARTPKNKLMLAAHMDEVGVIITGITDDGYLKFDLIGGIDRRVIIGRRVLFPNGVPGVIGLKAYHLVKKGEEKTVPKVTEMYIDIGEDSKEAAKNRVNLGDAGVFVSDAVEFGDGYLKAKAIDDRAGCAVLIKLIESELPADCWFAFTVQEEIGTRGALTAAYRLRPDIALVVEGTTAADLPTVGEEKRICAPKKGVVIPFMDKGAVYDRGLFTKLCSIADEKGIKWQTKEYIAGGTDAAAIQRTGEGVRTAGIAVAVRYIHSPSSAAAIEDFDSLYNLAAAFLETLE